MEGYNSHFRGEDNNTHAQIKKMHGIYTNITLQLNIGFLFYTTNNKKNFTQKVHKERSKILQNEHKQSVTSKY